ncbi:hypothetical protein AB0C21_33880 [Spirillospora sp. NPDC049024]
MEKAERDSDDFSGIGRTAVAVLIVAAALRHPLRLLKGVCRRAARVALAPVVYVAVRLWALRKDRRPTFEDHLRRYED